MRPGATGRFIVFALTGTLTLTAQAETCYSYLGFEVEDQQFCKGSGACCGVNDECMPNRLCKDRGSADNVLVRGTCSSESWDKERNCAEICNFNEVEQNTGLMDGVFPRVEICDEGIYCCRQGSASCCDRESRLVYLNEDGVRLSSPPSSTTSTTSEASSTDTEVTSTLSSSAEAESTTQSNSASEEDEDSEDDNSLGFKVGLGVAIPLAVATTALATWWFVSKRKTNANLPVGMSEVSGDQPYTTAKGEMSPQSRVVYGQMDHSHHVDAMGRGAPHDAQELEAPQYVR